MIEITQINPCLPAADRGAKWLDKRVPGWEFQIDPAWLDMSDGTKCILGQVFMEDAERTLGEYADGFDYAVAKFWPRKGEEMSARMGFDLGYSQWDDFYGSEAEVWEALAEAWIDTIKWRVNQ